MLQVPNQQPPAPTSHPMNRPDNYFSSREFKSNLQQYRHMLQGNGHVYLESDALMDIAEYFETVHRHDLARECVDYARSLHPDDDLPLIYSARMTLDEGQPDKAIILANEVNDKNSYEYFLLRGEILIFQLELNKANILFNQALKKIDEEDVTDFISDVAALYLDYEYPYRALYWLGRIAAESYDTRCRLLEAECHLTLEEYDKATESLKQLLDHNPYELQAWLLLAEAQYSATQYQQAVESCDFALAIDPDNEQAWKIKGCAADDLHQSATAHACYTRYLERDPESAIIHLLDANCLLAQGYPHEALGHLKQAGVLMRQQNTPLDKTFIPLAKTYSQLGDMASAFEYVEKAIHAGYDRFETDMVKIEIMLYHDMKQEAMTLLVALLHQSDLSPNSYLKVAQLCFTYELYDLALTLFKHLAQNASLRHECYPYMAYIYRARQDHDEYLRYLSMACVMNPDTTRTLFADIYPDTDVKYYPERALKEKWQDTPSSKTQSPGHAEEKNK